MKKIEQNVLAANSNKEIAYLCSKCSREVKKEATRCPHCGARLGDIRCPFCNFTGSVKDFSNDTCPKCGRKNVKSKKNPPLKKRTMIRTGNFSLTLKLFWAGLIVLTALILIVGILLLKHYEII